MTYHIHVLFSDVKFNSILNEEHYVYFSNKNDFWEKYKFYVNNYNEAQRIIEKTKKHVSSNFRMIDILQKAFKLL